MAEEKKKELDFTIDEAAQMQLLAEANAIERGGIADVIVIDGKPWHIRPTSMRQNLKMQNLDYDVMFWQRQLKEAKNARQAKRINAKMRKAYAKKAAHKVLGKRLWLVPFLYKIMWRRIYNNSEKVSATINSTETVGENKVFSLANLGSSKQALALSMMQVGEAVKERTQRGESAESMVGRDGLPKKEDNKSEAPSNARRTTKR